MGALISTVGTRYLISHFNRAFSEPRITQLRTQPSAPDHSGTGQPVRWYFNPAAVWPGKPAVVDLLWLTNNMKQAYSRRPNNEVFLPEDAARSPRAEIRWKHFLSTANPGSLTLANHQTIIQQIYAGLIGAYSYIEFDCVDGTAAGLQTVLYADEDDDHRRRYLKIVLVTPPINPAGDGTPALPPVDPPLP
jgi:hypothetical protein